MKQGFVRRVKLFFAAVIVAAVPGLAGAGPAERTPEAVLALWYRMALELVRHTPTYSPPVASRALGYLGVTAHEALAGGAPGSVSLAGQLNGLTPLPVRTPGAAYDEAVLLDAALGEATLALFSHTGPTGQRAMTLMRQRMGETVAAGVPEAVLTRSRAQGAAVARHILAWAKTDGGDRIDNMGFPQTYVPAAGAGAWVPTSAIRQQQAPLLPRWGENRPFAMPKGMSCRLPPPPAYSEEKDSVFYREAQEVHDAVKGLTAEQKAIARFWSDDPMLSPTPPGHWIVIARQLFEARGTPAPEAARVLARLGIAMADAFIGCWDSKYVYNLVRPVTYIRKMIDPAFEPLLITPPFPEYPSGHSTQSAAAAAVLADAFGADLAFTDRTHEDDNLPARHFASFAAAAREAAESRILGGIHFRSAAARGLEQGDCIAAYALRLEMGR